MREFPANPMQAAAFHRSPALSRTGAGNTQVSISFGEKTGLESLRAAWQSVASRHGILRSTFTPSAGEMLTVKERDSAGTDWIAIDWQGETPEDVPEKWNALLAADAARSFDPSILPLVRFHEIRLPGGNAHYLLTFPAFLLDEFSVGRVLADWLVAIGQPVSVEPAAVALSTPGSLAAWKEVLAGADRPLRLHPRPDGGSFARASTALGREETAAFAKLCADRNLDRQVVLQCLWALVLRRFGATGHLSLALHSARQPPEAGFFENWLPISQTWEGPVGAWLLAAQKRHETATANAWINPAQVLAATGLPFALQEIPVSFAWRGEPLNDIIHSVLPRWINFDTRVLPPSPSGLLLEAREGIRLSLRVDGPSEPAARDLLSRVTALIADLPELLDKPLAKVPILTPEETRTLRNWARGPESLEHPESIPAAFREVAARHPDAIAVQDGDYALTFSALDSLSDKLASHLAQAGLADGWHAGLFLSSTSWVAVALLGSWKAGNLCVALDPSSPPEWIESTLSSHDVGVVLCDAASAPLLDESSRRRIVLDQEWDTLETSDLPGPEISAETPAAILTGHCDGGVPIVRALTHGQLIAACIEGARVLHFDPGDSFLAHAAAGGGAFFDEWMLPLLAGGTVHLAGNDLLDPATAPVTHLRLTAPEWHNQAARWARREEHVPPTIRVVAVEAGSPRKAALDIWNQQANGSLNTLVFFSPAGLCGLGVASAASAEAATLAPGKPTPDVEVSIFDPDAHEMPPGYSGELVFRFPGWKKSVGASGRKGIATGLRGWRDHSGDLFIESDGKRVPGIPDAAAHRATESLLVGALDAHIGAHSWVLADSASPGLLAVSEWPLTRGGWIDEALLPVPEMPVPQTPKAVAPAPSAAASRPWNPVTVLHEKGGAPTLVLLPGASGTPDLYRDLATALGSTRRIIGLVARGFHNPEACHPSVESAAAAYIDVLLEEDPTASFVLAGFGFGGTVALEMVRQLAAAGRPAPELLLIGSVAPAVAEISGGWFSTVKDAFKRLSTPERMEPRAATDEPSASHESAWKKYRFRPGPIAARIVLPSDFPPDGAAKWLAVLPAARITPVKCRWGEMLGFPAVKRLAAILNNGDQPLA